VNFVDGDSVEVVPSSWVVNDICFWPPGPKAAKLIKNYASQPQESWGQFKVRKLHEYGKKPMHESEFLD